MDEELKLGLAIRLSGFFKQRKISMALAGLISVEQCKDLIRLMWMI